MHIELQPYRRESVFLANWPYVQYLEKSNKFYQEVIESTPVLSQFDKTGNMFLKVTVLFHLNILKLLNSSWK